MASAAAGLNKEPVVVKYEEGEKVLCYHGPLIYEAKVLKLEFFDDKTSLTGYTGPHYRVHYKGWKNTWDEWVPPTRLLKHTQENLDKQKDEFSKLPANPLTVPRGHRTNNSSSTHGSAHASVSVRAGRKEPQTQGRGTKRGRDELEPKQPEMKLQVPEIIKSLLLSDWECVSKEMQLVSLPKTPNVVELLDEFTQYLIDNRPDKLRDPAKLAPTIKSGLLTYFNKALGINLLYRNERPQYADVRKQTRTGQQVIIGQEKELSEVYGAEHLTRMLVALPQMIANTTLDLESVTLVADYVNELMLWMVENRLRLYSSEYTSKSPQYQNVSRT